MAAYRLDLAAIEGSLRALQREFPRINEILQSPRDRLDDIVIENLLGGYAFVDRALAAGLDLMTPGNLKHLLELNTLVLCGENACARDGSARHIEATAQRFWEQAGGGIRDVVDWHDRHRGESVWRRAAGVYIRVLSEPQLYIEGNHRTGALIMSYLLARDGRPPFVLTVDNAAGYFDPSTLVTRINKNGTVMLFRMPRLKKYFASYLKDHTNPTHLLKDADPLARQPAAAAESTSRPVPATRG